MEEGKEAGAVHRSERTIGFFDEKGDVLWPPVERDRRSAGVP